jgi:hypothetical protein
MACGVRDLIRGELKENSVVNLMMQNYVDPYSLCCLFTIIVSVRFDRMVVGFTATYAISAYHY